jgi:hypothetical protein
MAPLLNLTRGEIAQEDARAILALGHQRRGHLNEHTLVGGWSRIARNQAHFRHGNIGVERIRRPCTEVIRRGRCSAGMIVDVTHDPHLRSKVVIILHREEWLAGVVATPNGFGDSPGQGILLSCDIDRRNTPWKGPR